MNIAVLHPQCRVRWWAIKMALLTAQSLQKQGHKVMFYTFDHAPECFPELQEGLTLFTSATTKAPNKTKITETASEWIKSTVDTVDKVFTFWSIFRSLFPNISRSISLAWSIRQVDIVIAHNPPMQMVGALAKVFSFFSRYHQLLTVVWWHHHTPWYFVPNKKIQSTKYKILSLFSLIFWKSWFERRFVLPHIKYVIATSYYVAFCLEKYSWRKAIVVHPVIVASSFSDEVKRRSENPGEKENPSKGIKWNDLDPRVPPEADRQPEDDGQVRPVVLFTHGRLEPGKWLDTLVKMWKELQEMQNTKSIRLLIAWEGSLKTWLIEQGATVISYRDGLLEEIQKTENDTLAIYLSTIDAFGMASLEAQIAGLETIILDR